MKRPSQAVSELAALARNENLRRVELAWGASIAAEWTHFVALGVFAYNTGGASAVGIAGLVRMLPAALVPLRGDARGPLPARALPRCRLASRVGRARRLGRRLLRQ